MSHLNLQLLFTPSFLCQGFCLTSVTTLFVVLPSVGYILFNTRYILQQMFIFLYFLPPKLGKLTPKQSRVSKDSVWVSCPFKCLQHLVTRLRTEDWRKKSALTYIIFVCPHTFGHHRNPGFGIVPLHSQICLHHMPAVYSDKNSLSSQQDLLSVTKPLTQPLQPTAWLPTFSTLYYFNLLL